MSISIISLPTRLTQYQLWFCWDRTRSTLVTLERTNLRQLWSSVFFLGVLSTHCFSKIAQRRVFSCAIKLVLFLSALPSRPGLFIYVIKFFFVCLPHEVNLSLWISALQSEVGAFNNIKPTFYYITCFYITTSYYPHQEFSQEHW